MRKCRPKSFRFSVPIVFTVSKASAITGLAESVLIESCIEWEAMGRKEVVPRGDPIMKEYFSAMATLKRHDTTERKFRPKSYRFLPEVFYLLAEASRESGIAETAMVEVAIRRQMEGVVHDVLSRRALLESREGISRFLDSVTNGEDGCSDVGDLRTGGRSAIQEGVSPEDAFQSWKPRLSKTASGKERILGR